MIAHTIQPGDWVDLLGEWREVLEIGHNAHPDYTGFVPTVTMRFLGSVVLSVAADRDLPVRQWCVADRNGEVVRTEGTSDDCGGSEPGPSREELLQMLSTVDARLRAMSARDVPPATDDIVAAIRGLGSSQQSPRASGNDGPRRSYLRQRELPTGERERRPR